MIFKSIQILFLLTANIILLASGTLKHHHHNEQVCFINSHNHNDDSGCDGTDENTHNTDYESHCVLKQAVVVLPQGLRISPGQHLDFKFLKSFHEVLSEVSLANNYIPEPGLNIKFLNRSDDAPLYSLIVNNSHGLRAPPLS